MSRYADSPEVVIDESKIPVQFRHLVSMAKEWSIGDDVELDKYIAMATEEKKREFFEAFRPHFSGLARWGRECADLVPQPDELIIFDLASNAASTVGATF